MKFFTLAASCRKQSFNKKLLTVANEHLRSLGHEITSSDLNEFSVPLFNQDEEQEHGVSAGALRFSETMQEADATIFAVPEYNFSIPGIFKNLIDWVSRAKPNPWANQNILLLSASPSMVGGNRGLWVTRMSLESCGSLVYPGMFSLASAHDAFDDAGKLANKELQARLEALLLDYVNLVEKLR